MAFLNKLNDLTKNLADKTSDALETAKLNGKIAAEKSAIVEDEKKIGAAVYANYQQGLALGEGLDELLAGIDARYAEIGEATEQLKALKEPAPAAAPAAPEGVTCPQCGKLNPAGAKFCSGCGAKQEPPAPPVEKRCAACGEVVPEGVRFCSACGAKQEEAPAEPAE